MRPVEAIGNRGRSRVFAAAGRAARAPCIAADGLSASENHGRNQSIGFFWNEMMAKFDVSYARRPARQEAMRHEMAGR